MDMFVILDNATAVYDTLDTNKYLMKKNDIIKCMDLFE